MLTITTELDAVNMILSSIGSDPVNTLTGTTDVDVVNALRLLEEASRDIQRKGWDFNKGVYTFHPNLNDHKILWDNAILYHKSTDGNTYVKREDHLYDMTNKTFEFYNDIELEVIIGLDFMDLPDCFKNYITAKASMAFQTRYLGDTNISQFLAMEIQEAYQDIVAYDMNMSSVNMLQLTNIADVLTRS